MYGSRKIKRYSYAHVYARVHNKCDDPRVVQAELAYLHAPQNLGRSLGPGMHWQAQDTPNLTAKASIQDDDMSLQSLGAASN